LVGGVEAAGILDGASRRDGKGGEEVTGGGQLVGEGGGLSGAGVVYRRVERGDDCAVVVIIYLH
jgi:hypothetical protein